jgi:hypothetical protein
MFLRRRLMASARKHGSAPLRVSLLAMESFGSLKEREREREREREKRVRRGSCEVVCGAWYFMACIPKF